MTTSGLGLANGGVRQVLDYEAALPLDVGLLNFAPQASRKRPVREREQTFDCGASQEHATECKLKLAQPAEQFAADECLADDRRNACGGDAPENVQDRREGGRFQCFAGCHERRQTDVQPRPP